MNSHVIKSTADWSAGRAVSHTTAAKINRPTEGLVPATRTYGLRLLLAAVPALAIIAGTVWVVSDALEPPRVLQALVWAAGFIFLALALDAGKRNTVAVLVTGLALPALAILSAFIATEFLIIATALIAAWVVAVILQ